MALGIPPYPKATGIIPVAEAILAKGVALGTALALMMSTAPLSLPEIVILYKAIRWPGLLVFADLLAVALALVGWAFNAAAGLTQTAAD